MGSRTDTIVAVATPAGVGGIAVVRLSGPQALDLALPHLDVEQLQPRYATYCRFADIDDVVAIYYPKGYTGEPTVEISLHGSLFLQRAAVQLLCQSGARLAEPGEYTLRAFLNGRLNLAQAEAVADLIEATTPAQHRLAQSQLRGGYASKLKQLRQQLVDLTSLFELELDFSQEDVEFADRSEMLRLMGELQAEVQSLLDSFAAGNALKQGIPVAIVGHPNVGKSTLLNALLNDDRAIVSDIPGTTRDTVEGMLTLDGITFRLIDTAGFRTPEGLVEALGLERSRAALAESSIVVEVEEATATSDAPITSTPLDGKHHIRLLNKCDLMPAPPTELCFTRGDTRFIYASAKLGQGVDQLKKALVEAVGNRMPTDVLLANARHRDALQRMLTALQAVQQGLTDGLPTDLVAVDLRDALYHLGTITGDVSNDELLGNIFSRFCIGK